MTTEPPSDLKSVAEISRELGIPEPTIRNWQARGWVSRWKVGGRRGLASVEEVRRFATTPRKEDPRGDE